MGFKPSEADRRHHDPGREDELDPDGIARAGGAGAPRAVGTEVVSPVPCRTSSRTSTRTANASSTTSSSGFASPRSPATRSTQPTWRRTPSTSRRTLRALGAGRVEVWPHGRAPRRLRRVDARAGQAHAARLRPPRRAAGRPAGRVGHAAVRAEHPLGAALGARRRRRQGAGLHPREGDRELRARRSATLPINLKLIVEGEEEVGSVNLDTLMRDARRRTSRPTSSA